MLVAVLSPAAQVSIQYDSLNRLTNVEYGNGTVINYTYDAAGNRLTYSGAVTNDAVAPNVAITSPTAGATFATTVPLINLGGTSSDNVGVTLVDWSNDRGGMGTASGTTIWAITGIALQLGTNVISVTAYDASGNGGVATLAVNYVPPGPVTNLLFTDAFSDSVIDPNKWTTSGSTVTEASQMMQVLTTVSDNGGGLASVPAPISPHGDITITRRVLLHYANQYFAARMNVKFGDLPWAGVHYGNYFYASTYYGWEDRYGIYLSRNDVGYSISVISSACDTNLAGPFSPIWDTWFKEKLVYSPDTGNLQYYTNDQKVADYFIGIMPPTNAPTIQFQFQAWGWYTGHQQLFDDFLVTQTATAATQVQLTGMGLSNGVFRCILSGLVGSNYLIEASSNLFTWSPISMKTIPVAGSISITDLVSTDQPQRFYRAVQVPTNMVLIPAGSFTMGDNLDGDSYALPLHTVYVSSFYMDKYLVTSNLWWAVKLWNGGNGYSYDHAGSGKAASHPVQTVNWWDCVKWCNARSQMDGLEPCYYADTNLTVVYKSGQMDPSVKWSASGYRLPTEAEWEKAARGGASGHRFPWSDADTITHSQANYISSSAYSYDISPTRGYHPTFNDGVWPYTSPVGYFAPNGYGLYDMAGNVCVWCWDWSDYYSSSPQSDPRGPASGSSRAVRNGSCYNDAPFSRCSARFSGKQVDAYANFSFRCVRVF